MISRTSRSVLGGKEDLHLEEEKNISAWRRKRSALGGGATRICAANASALAWLGQSHRLLPDQGEKRRKMKCLGFQGWVSCFYTRQGICGLWWTFEWAGSLSYAEII
jgi:hypothetical protein